MIWKHDFQTGVNLNQSDFSSNWKAGGTSAFAVNGFLNLLSSYDTTHWNITSDLQLALGYTQIKGQETRKSADRAFYDLKGGYKLRPHLQGYASINFLSQFAEGFDYKTKDVKGNDSAILVSNAFAPAYLTTSLGLEYKPVDYFWTRFGVGTLRQTYVFDDRIRNQGLYGLEKKADGTYPNTRYQLVFQFIANFARDIGDNMTLKWRYTLNVDYFKMGQPGDLVHIGSVNLTLKVNKYINTNLSYNILYDYDQDHKVQSAEVLALSVLYSWKQ